VLAEGDKDYPYFTDMKLKGDGACVVVDHMLGAQPNAGYRVTGMTIDFIQDRSGNGVGWIFWIASVTDAERVLEVKKGDGVVKARYTRPK
jgi:hypothetical protein